MDCNEALKEIHETIVWALETIKKAETAMEATVMYGLALGRIGLVLQKMGFDFDLSNNEQ